MGGGVGSAGRAGPAVDSGDGDGDYLYGSRQPGQRGDQGAAGGRLRGRRGQRPLVSLHLGRSPPPPGVLGPSEARLPGVGRLGRRARSLGTAALALLDRLFAAWHRARDDPAASARLPAVVQPLQAEFRALLEEGAASPCAKAAGLCRALLKLWPALWTFVTVPGVEPTNNAAERAAAGRPLAQGLLRDPVRQGVRQTPPATGQDHARWPAPTRYPPSSPPPTGARHARNRPRGSWR